MARKDKQEVEQAAATPISAVDATNHYNRHVAGFAIDLGIQVTEDHEVIAGVSLEMENGEIAFIPADFLRALADESEESARKAIAQAQRG